MAQRNRETNDLRTLKLRLVPARSESIVWCDFYRGRDHLAQMRFPADAFAIPGSLTIDAVREHAGRLFDPAAIAAHGGLADISQFLGDAGWLDDGEPLWLQIAQGSSYLATVPWEALVRDLTQSAGLAIFRIPNFVGTPEFVASMPRIAICASSPRAKSPFEPQFHVRDAIVALTETLDAGEIHVFVDQGAHDGLGDLARDGAGRVVIHDPEQARDFGTGARRLSESSGTTSPWLMWMEEQLGPRRTDLVHFITPGYFTTDLGGLALAHSPLTNEDRRRSHFVSAAETNEFLNAVGAWAAGFTIPEPDPWSIGVRIFAEQLARHRSEPITVHEHLLAGGYGALATMYRAVLSPGDAQAPVTPGLSAHVHPQRFVPDDELDRDVVSVAQLDFAGEASDIADGPWREVLAKSASTRRTSGTDARWRASLQLEVEQTMSKLVADRIDTPEQRGEAAALTFIQQALDSSSEADP